MRRIFSIVLLMSAVAPLATVTASSAATKPAHSLKKVPKTTTVNVPKGWPVQIHVQRIGIRAPVEALALTKKADTEAPYKWGDVAWFDRGARPGDMGRAVMFGHLDSTCCPAVFYHLNLVKPGDVVEVQYKSGVPLKFRVMWNAKYSNAKLPEKWLFAMAKERGLSLITCAGVFHRKGIGYDQREVVYARLLLPNGQVG